MKEKEVCILQIQSFLFLGQNASFILRKLT